MDRQTLEDLIDHEHWLGAGSTLSSAFERFREHAMEFMAVLDEGEFVGLCSRQDLGMFLGSKYGFSLHASRSILECLRPHPVQLLIDSDVHEAFERVFARSIESFYDDVVVLDTCGRFRGLIYTHTLVRLQNHYHKESISLLERQTRAIESQNMVMEADLRLCWDLQRALLPESYPQVPMPNHPEVSAYDFHHLYQTHHIVGGDFIHAQRISAHAIGVMVADVMGHNVRCALVTTMIRAFLDELTPRFPDPGELLTRLNERLAPLLSKGQQEVVYATAVYLTLDAETQTCSFASAAHPAPIRLSREKGSVELIEHSDGGTLLGVFDDAIFTSERFELDAGDRILLYTDGIFEVEGQTGELWGQKGLLSILEPYHHDSGSKDLLSQLVDAARRYSGQDHFRDDVCLLEIKVHGA